jgi:hypothetical protein
MLRELDEGKEDEMKDRNAPRSAAGAADSFTEWATSPGILGGKSSKVK